MGNVSLEQKEAGLMQMKINTRLTALQTALEIMRTEGYRATYCEDTPVKPGAVDHITLLAMAGDIEAYIIGDLQAEAKKAIDEAKNPRPSIIRGRI